jgi:ribonuclease VapC
VILDSSPVVSVLLRESGHQPLEQKMREADLLGIGAPTLLETEMVMISARGEAGRKAVSRFCATLDVVVVPFGARHEDVAVEVFSRFGKGRHPAALNYGDCMAYATARVADEPLLYIGNDFARTDIQAA